MIIPGKTKATATRMTVTTAEALIRRFAKDDPEWTYTADHLYYDQDGYTEIVALLVYDEENRLLGYL